MVAIDWVNSTKLFDNKRLIYRANAKPFHANLNKVNYMFFPYIAKNHYTLVVLDFERRAILQHNPMEGYQILSEEQMFVGIMRYFRLYEQINKTKFANNNWEIVVNSLPGQKDLVSCGVCILWYMQLYVNSSHINSKQFIANEFRQEMLGLQQQKAHGNVF